MVNKQFFTIDNSSKILYFGFLHNAYCTNGWLDWYMHIIARHKIPVMYIIIIFKKKLFAILKCSMCTSIIAVNWKIYYKYQILLCFLINVDLNVTVNDE